MTKQQEAIKADVLGMLIARVDSIFIDMQQAMGIKSGDISPLDAIKLRHKEEQLADRIMDILLQQKGDE